VCTGTAHSGNTVTEVSRTTDKISENQQCYWNRPVETDRGVVAIAYVVG